MTKRALDKRGLVVLFSMLAIAAASGSVLAGQKQEVAVTVSSTSASGSVGTARASADSNQMIQCLISGTTAFNTVSCSAKNAGGTFFSCTGNSNADKLAAAVAGIGPNSVIQVFANSSGACTQIISYNGSQYRPAVP